MNNYKLIKYDYSHNENKWFNGLTNLEINNILHSYYETNVDNIKITNVDKKNKGENIIENILIEHNIPYINSSSKPHSGDFICYNKIVLDSKYYLQNKLQKLEIDKLKTDMNNINIKYGIIIVLTSDTFNIEYYDNCIVVLYVSDKNIDFIWLYLEMFIKMFLNIPENNDLEYLQIDKNIIHIINEYNDIVNKLQNIKNNLNNIIQQLYIYNNKLEETIYSNYIINAHTNDLLNINYIEDINKDILHILNNVTKPNNVLYNKYKIIMQYNSNSIILHTDKQKKYKIEFDNIAHNMLIAVLNKYESTYVFSFNNKCLSFDIEINKKLNTIILDYIEIINHIISLFSNE